MSLHKPLLLHVYIGMPPQDRASIVISLHMFICCISCFLCANTPPPKKTPKQNKTKKPKSNNPGLFTQLVLFSVGNCCQLLAEKRLSCSLQMLVFPLARNNQNTIYLCIYLVFCLDFLGKKIMGIKFCQLTSLVTGIL